jgi:hypothetical protein
LKPKVFALLDHSPSDSQGAMGLIHNSMTFGEVASRIESQQAALKQHILQCDSQPEIRWCHNSIIIDTIQGTSAEMNSYLDYWIQLANLQRRLRLLKKALMSSAPAEAVEALRQHDEWDATSPDVAMKRWPDAVCEAQEIARVKRVDRCNRIRQAVL